MQYDPNLRDIKPEGKIVLLEIIEKLEKGTQLIIVPNKSFYEMNLKKMTEFLTEKKVPKEKCQVLSPNSAKNKGAKIAHGFSYSVRWVNNEGSHHSKN